MTFGDQFITVINEHQSIHNYKYPNTIEECHEVIRQLMNDKNIATNNYISVKRDNERLRDLLTKDAKSFEEAIKMYRDYIEIAIPKRGFRALKNEILMKTYWFHMDNGHGV